MHLTSSRALQKKRSFSDFAPPPAHSPTALTVVARCTVRPYSHFIPPTAPCVYRYIGPLLMLPAHPAVLRLTPANSCHFPPTQRRLVMRPLPAPRALTQPRSRRVAADRQTVHAHFEATKLEAHILRRAGGLLVCPCMCIPRGRPDGWSSRM